MREWLADNWFLLFNTASIVAGLLFTASSLRSETKTRRISNLLIVTQNHREIWTEIYQRPELFRVTDPKADLRREPITREEELFVTLLVLHLSSSYHAMKDGLFIKQDGLRQDIQEFFSLPIPQAVWERIKGMQDDDFVRFVEACLGRKEGCESGTKTRATRPFNVWASFHGSRMSLRDFQLVKAKGDGPSCASDQSRL